jgi:hypothetical protein
LIILLAIPGEAKPVIIGFKGNVNSADIETYNITNYTLHKSINAVSADISELTFRKLKNNKRIRYVEDYILVNIQKRFTTSSRS